MNKQKIACLGAGYFAQFHHDAWRRNPRCELVGIADENPDKDAGFSSLGALLVQHSPDVIDIVTPPNTHLGAIETALAAKPKAVICQKPFCEDLEQAKDATRMAAEADVPLIVHENFRFQPWYRLMKAQVSDAALGDIYQMTFRLRTGDGQGPGAYLERQPYFQEMPRFLIRETGVHFIDVFRFLFGDPTSVYADLRRLNPALAGEDAGIVVFEFPGDVRAVFDGNRLADHAAENHRLTLGEASLEGSLGTVSLEGSGQVSFRTKGEIDTQTRLSAQTWQGFGGDCVYALQEHVVKGLLDGTPFENEAADYLKVLQIEAAIYQSAETGQKVTLQ